jgi:hypothetical protein
MHYSFYIDYLIENKFMRMISNYYVSKKSKTYKLNITELDITRGKVHDPVLLKKYKKEYLERSLTEYNNSSIPIEIRRKLVDDLFHVKIDYYGALEYLNSVKNKMETNKYFKNLNSIDSINSGYMFFKFDEYGRFHTNFTILKKDIRKNYLTIDDEELTEIDIKNSQPFFFGVLLKQEIGDKLNEECIRYIEIVNNGLIYDELMDNFPDKILTRDSAKLVIYKVLFGSNGETKEPNIMFSKLYPTVYEYIKELKSMNKSYRELSHQLQKMESDFIFNVVIKQIMEKFPEIRVFTVHDSIIFPLKFKVEVETIFRTELNKLIQYNQTD